MDKYYLNKYLKYKNKYSFIEKNIKRWKCFKKLIQGSLMKYKLDILNYAFFAKFAYATYDDFLCFLRAMIYNYLIRQLLENIIILFSILIYLIIKLNITNSIY